jgi:hypothetical protein
VIASSLSLERRSVVPWPGSGGIGSPTAVLQRQLWIGQLIVAGEEQSSPLEPAHHRVSAIEANGDEIGENGCSIVDPYSSPRAPCEKAGDTIASMRRSGRGPGELSMDRSGG